MHFPTILTGLGLMASVASAAPFVKEIRQVSGAQNVVYWGQNGGGTIENNDLSSYCTSTSGIDIIVLGFLYEFGNGDTIPSGTIGQSCYISTSGEGQDCDNVASSIATCQAAGIKIILSLGGASGSYTLTSESEAQTIANNLWAAFGNSGNTAVQRPFGSNFVNGFDFDIEVSSGQNYYQYMISALRSNFASDSAHTYYITGAPQCPLPEPNMGVIIQNSKFDYLWPQFYNNNNYTYPCALPFNGNAAFNYDQWESFLSSTPSSAAKIFIGVPAAPLAANGSPSGETYYITPAQLAELISQYGSQSSFGGIMMWSAGFSDSNVNNGCTYAQEAHAILTTGSPCVNGPGTGGGNPNPGNPTTTSTVTTATATSTAPAGTGTPVAQWGQCGGEGYTGSTLCASPYKCVATSVWWSQCE